METQTDITLSDGGTTVLHVARTDERSAPFVLVLPAMGVPAGYYGPFIEDLARHGVHAGVADYPGQSEARPRAGRGRDHGYTEVAHEWLPEVIAAVRREHDGPLVLLGHSLGGHLLTTHLADGSTDVAAGVIIGSGTPYWRHQQGLKTLAQTQLIAVVARVAGYWPGKRFGFGGTQSRTLMLEWAHFARTGRLAPRGQDVAPRLRDVELPLLVVDLDNDTLAPPAATDGLVEMLPSADVERVGFSKGPDDPGKPVNHYSFARSPEIIGERIATWVRARVGTEVEQRD